MAPPKAGSSTTPCPPIPGTPPIWPPAPTRVRHRRPTPTGTAESSPSSNGSTKAPKSKSIKPHHLPCHGRAADHHPQPPRLPGRRAVVPLRLLGRVVLNVDPNTTQAFNPIPPQIPVHSKPGAMPTPWKRARWHQRRPGLRHQLPPTKPRTPLGEDYSPCAAHHPNYSAPNLTTGDGFEVFQRYDFLDPEAATIPNFLRSPQWLIGLMASTSDRGQRDDPRMTGAPPHRDRPKDRQTRRTIAALSDRYTPHGFVKAVTCDGADRPVAESTGAERPELLGENDASLVFTEYSKRGTIKSVKSSYGDPSPASPGTPTASLKHHLRRRRPNLHPLPIRSPPSPRKRPNRSRPTQPLDRRPPAYSPAPPPPGSEPSTLQLILEDTQLSTTRSITPSRFATTEIRPTGPGRQTRHEKPNTTTSIASFASTPSTPKATIPDLTLRPRERGPPTAERAPADAASHL